VHPNYKTKYRVTNWAEYDRALVRRGDVTLWISEDAIAAWKPTLTGRRGAQQKFSDHAIETALTLRQVFKLPLRGAERFLKSILSLMSVDLEAPDHTTLSRRGQRLDIKLDVATADMPIHLVVDSTGLSIIGEGEWAAAKHGERDKCVWKKMHFGVDGNGLIVAQVLTDASADDAKTGLRLIQDSSGNIASVTADAAYDTIAFYEAAHARGAKVVLPPIRTAKVTRRGSRSAARDRTIVEVARIGRRNSRLIFDSCTNAVIRASVRFLAAFGLGEHRRVVDRQLFSDGFAQMREHLGAPFSLIGGTRFDAVDQLLVQITNERGAVAARRPIVGDP
jgi:hypothetical protein